MITGCIIFAFRLLWEGIEVFPKIRYNQALSFNFGWHVLLAIQGKIRVGDPVNIIQHPHGEEKAVVVHNSHFLHLENGTNSEQFCWYSGDTEKGSSGAPVFNNRGKSWHFTIKRSQKQTVMAKLSTAMVA